MFPFYLCCNQVAANVKSPHKIINVAFNVKLKLLVIEFECTEDKHNFRDMNLELKEEGRAMSGQNICRPPEQELRPNDREKSALPCLMRRVLNRNLFEGNYKTRYCGWKTALQKLAILSLAGNGKLTALRIWTGA